MPLQVWNKNDTGIYNHQTCDLDLTNAIIHELINHLNIQVRSSMNLATLWYSAKVLSVFRVICRGKESPATISEILGMTN